MSQLNFLFILSHFKEKDGSPFLGALLKIGEKGGFDQIDSDLFEEVAQITCRGGTHLPKIDFDLFFKVKKLLKVPPGPCSQP